MNPDDNLEIPDRDEDTLLLDLLDQAETSLAQNRDDKYWVNRDEIFLLANEAEEEPNIYQDLSENWVIEIVVRGTRFIHVTSFQNFIGQRVH